MSRLYILNNLSTSQSWHLLDDLTMVLSGGVMGWGGCLGGGVMCGMVWLDGGRGTKRVPDPLRSDDHWLANL